VIEDFFSADARNFQPSAIRAFARLMNDPAVISFAGGAPSPETFPAGPLAEIAARVLRERPNVALKNTAQLKVVVTVVRRNGLSPGPQVPVPA